MLKLRYQIKLFKKLSHWNVFLKNIGILSTQLSTDEEHMYATMDWLCRAQDVTNCGGVSAGYSLEKAWREPYPETTGYIIKTFIKYFHHANKSEYLKRAVEMGDWEIDIQLSSGAVSGGVGINKSPIVFNTGQVLLGWVDLYQETKSERFIKAAVKASNWLLEIQDSDGKWSKFVYNDIPHSYHTMVAWSILGVYQITKNKKYLNAAKRQILWALSNATENGWFELAAFTKERLPITHTIGYTLQGLFESSKYFKIELKQKILTVIESACVNIMLEYEKRKKRNPFSNSNYLQASFDEKWKSLDKYSCLTGNCQIAICFMELYKINNDIKLLNAAHKITNQIKSTQILKSKNKGIQGGIQGSYPIWGKYKPFNYPNWAAKYFVDSLLIKEEILTI